MPELSLARAPGSPDHLAPASDLVSTDVADGLDRLGLALADPIRRAVLLRLLDGTHRPSELAVAIGTSRSNLSNHLTCLRGCGLIRAERSGRHLHYELVSDQLADALRSLISVAGTLLPCDEHGPSTSAEIGRR